MACFKSKSQRQQARCVALVPSPCFAPPSLVLFRNLWGMCFGKNCHLTFAICWSFHRFVIRIPHGRKCCRVGSSSLLSPPPPHYHSAARRQQYIHQQCEATALTLYLAQAAPFSKTLFGQDVDAATWWAAGRRLGYPPQLTDFALRLHAVKAASAGLERELSAMRVTYGMLRGRLGIEKAKKLSFVRRSFKRKRS